jgi:3-methyl-2-oxobutanoate hydroxymethyltransferase
LHKTIQDITKMKGKEKISILTGYDSTMASLCDQVDVILVGDSAGMVMLGYENTVSVTMNNMEMFTKAVSNARQNSLIVADLPFKSYENKDDAIKNSTRLIKAGADAVKLEGGNSVSEIIKAITQAGIPVMGHLGLLPQTAKKYTVQAKTKDDAVLLLEDAKKLQSAGVFSIVLEMVSSEAARMITKHVSVPTIGIGAGKDCDGQVLVVHDMLGMFEKIKPKFAKRYLSLSNEIKNAVNLYIKDVKSGTFPAKENSFQMIESESEKMREAIV